MTQPIMLSDPCTSNLRLNKKKLSHMLQRLVASFHQTNRYAKNSKQRDGWKLQRTVQHAGSESLSSPYKTRDQETSHTCAKNVHVTLHRKQVTCHDSGVTILLQSCIFSIIIKKTFFGALETSQQTYCKTACT